MSERTEYAPGTPSWIDHASADPSAAAEFYGVLFGWQTEDRMPDESDGEYHMATIGGKEVAALGSNPVPGAPAGWNTYFTVASADEAVAKVGAAGGAVMMEPFDIFDAGRMAALADPAGAAFMVWEPNRSIGAERVNEPGALVWNELTTRDVEGSKGFYGEVFGWTTTSMPMADGEYVIWHLDGEEAGIGGMMPMVGDSWPEDMPPHWMVYLSVEDTDAAAALCEERGGTVSVAPFDAEGVGRIAVLSDPQGAVFSVIRNAPGTTPQD